MSGIQSLYKLRHFLTDRWTLGCSSQRCRYLYFSWRSLLEFQFSRWRWYRLSPFLQWNRLAYRRLSACPCWVLLVGLDSQAVYRRWASQSVPTLLSQCTKSCAYWWSHHLWELESSFPCKSDWRWYYRWPPSSSVDSYWRRAWSRWLLASWLTAQLALAPVPIVEWMSALCSCWDLWRNRLRGRRRRFARGSNSSWFVVYSEATYSCTRGMLPHRHEDPLHLLSLLCSPPPDSTCKLACCKCPALYWQWWRWVRASLGRWSMVGSWRAYWTWWPYFLRIRTYLAWQSCSEARSLQWSLSQMLVDRLTRRSQMDSSNQAPIHFAWTLGTSTWVVVRVSVGSN